MKTSLQIYVQYINSKELHINDVVDSLKASGLNIPFRNYENTDIHIPLKSRDKKTDGELDKFYRRVKLLKAMEVHDNGNLNIDDTVINTESNLWYVVLQKNLYRVGLPTNLFDNEKNDIDALVNRRNSIAHGDMDSGVEVQEYNKWFEKTNRIENDCIRLLYEYAKKKEIFTNNERINAIAVRS